MLGSTPEAATWVRLALNSKVKVLSAGLQRIILLVVGWAIGSSLERSSGIRFDGWKKMHSTQAQAGLFNEALIAPKRPLLKWAGGKTQLIGVLRRAAPKEFSRYAEVFFGGGALFWSLALPGSLIADSNPELINFYEMVRDAPHDLVSVVGRLAITKPEYYRIRAQQRDQLSEVDRAARFVVGT